MILSRRSFLIGGSAAALASGCRGPRFIGSGDLRLGVISDIHIREPESAETTERAFRFYRSRGVDAVLIAGDLSDWGLLSGFRILKETWDRVFAGTGVVPLFITGNHDFDGWHYGDMTMEMHALGYDESEAAIKLGMRRCWEETFGEHWAPVRLRTVRGFDFVSCEWGADGEFVEWMKANGGRFRGGKPFFFFRHSPLKGTVCGRSAGDDAVKAVLEGYPNCIALTGHIHYPFNDDRAIWQGAFTAISVPSLSYSTAPEGHENGYDDRTGKSKLTMPLMTVRRDLRGDQGYLIEVRGDEVSVERYDFDEMEDGASDWSFSTARDAARPYAPEVRVREMPAPVFPAGAKLKVTTTNTDNRAGHWTIALDCRFPSAKVAGSRVFDYEIRAVPKDGSEPLVKRFLSPAFALMEKFEPKVQRFWFDVAELPQDKEYVLEVYARNCFGRASSPLVSAVRRGKPGLGKAVR